MGNASRTVFSAFAAIFVAIAWTTEPSAGDIRRIEPVAPDDPFVASCAQLAEVPSGRSGEPAGKRPNPGVQEPERPNIVRYIRDDENERTELFRVKGTRCFPISPE